jgi:16S rRNA C967 or C1407 C5-methylase (RsmB/RsmF family)/NOL1/NOP2/fmu family ribosome biogenesis protein
MEHRLPHSFLSSLEKNPDFDMEAFVEAHEKYFPVTSVRFNPQKKSNHTTSLNIAEQIPWSSAGFYLTERPSFTIDPLIHAGAYYVQEASSMFLEEVLNQTVDLNASIKVLDLCAAPGGKSTLIQSLISHNSLLVSNEVIKTRVNILSENITKWGASNVVVTNNDPSDFKKLPGFFDLIVVDAPCSGSGLFRKDPDAIEQWSLDNVNLCSHRQQRILSDIIDSLKPGGTLIYSTCSYSIEENEQISNWLIKIADFISLKINTDPHWNIVESKIGNSYGYRFYPNKIKGEGFFISAFRKSGESSSVKNEFSKIKNKKSNLQLLKSSAFTKWIIENKEMAFLQWKDDVIVVPESIQYDLPILQSALYIKKAGVNIGSMIREELIPSHELAMSTLISNTIPSIEVDLETALNYLRHESINKSFSQSGWVLLKYGGLPLGFIKTMTNRINNYYPREWRILNK